MTAFCADRVFEKNRVFAVITMEYAHESPFLSKPATTGGGAKEV